MNTLTLEEVCEALKIACDSLCNNNEAHGELYDAYIALWGITYYGSESERKAVLRNAARQAVCALAVAVSKAS